MKDQITYSSKLAELRLLLEHPLKKNKIFILVEGDSDIRLYRKLFCNIKTEIKSIPGGCVNLEKALKELNKEYKTVIGIRDADFIHISKKKTGIPALFLTDVHDMEMMLILSDSTFKSIFCEFYENTISDLDDVRTHLVNAVKFIGYLRWYNDIHNLELNFNGLGIGDFIAPSSLVINEMKCVQNILMRSPNKKIIDENILFENVKKYPPY